MSEERLMKTPEEVRQKAKELLQMPKEEVLTKYMFQKQEIERLKLELSGYRQAILQDKEMLGLKQKNERLNNIIKEVREYIEIIVKSTPSSTRKDYANMLLIDYKKILEILEKGE